VRVRADGRAGLGHDLAVHADETGQDQPARTLARRREAAGDERRVEA
jgi:hypothetical protein